MDVASFGSFAQRMFDAGLVFNIRFTEDELGQLPRWSLFDRKIMDQVTSLPGELKLPPRPSNVSSSANTTLWTFIKCHLQTQRNNYGCKVIHLNPPSATITPSMYTLETLIRELAMPNPISCSDDVLVTDNLIIIGTSSRYCLEYNICIEF